MKSILIVDDSSSLRTIVKLALVEKGYEVEESCDGREASLFINKKNYNLIISDVNMPNMNGMDFSKNVRNSQFNKATPILMLTTEDSTVKKNEAKKIGVTGWLHKPFQPSMLIKAVEKLIK